MKVKVKFDLASIKGWIFEHGEKVAFGAMVLVFLLFVYSAATREVLDSTKQPEKLQEVANNVNNHVRQSVWKQDEAGVQIVDFQERAKRDPLPLKEFALVVPLNNPVVDFKGKRDDPTILNVEELRVRSGVGTFALRSETPAGAAGAGVPARRVAAAAPSGGGGGGRPGEGFRPSAESKLVSQAWTVITALVPFEKQHQEYDRLFANAEGDSTDRNTPHYSGAIVERAEIDPKNPDKLEWKEIASVDALEKLWEARGDEIVAPKYIDSTLTSPLGPLVGYPWGESVGHPKIPLIGAAEEPAPPPAAPAAPAAADPIHRPAAGPVASQPKAPAVPPPSANAPPPYKLLRVFDYHVEPMRRYRYRVKLEVHNPNYNMAARYLKNPGAASNKQEYRTSSDWVTADDAVTIPSGYDVLAAGVEPKGNEPSASLLLTAIEGGIPASTKTKLYRGSLANKKESRVRAKDPRNLQTTLIDEVDFKTNMVVVDISGGRPISLQKRKESPFTAPGEVLLLDASGNLVVHNDMDDRSQYNLRKPPEESETSRADLERDDSKSKKSARGTSKSGK